MPRSSSKPVRTFVQDQHRCRHRPVRMLDSQARCDRSHDRRRNTNRSHDRKRCGPWRDRLAQQLERPGPAHRHFIAHPIEVNRDSAVGERDQPAARRASSACSGSSSATVMAPANSHVQPVTYGTELVQCAVRPRVERLEVHQHTPRLMQRYRGPMTRGRFSRRADRLDEPGDRLGRRRHRRFLRTPKADQRPRHVHQPGEGAPSQTSSPIRHGATSSCAAPIPAAQANTNM